MQDLSVTLIQTDTIWEDISANLDALDRTIDRLEGSTDLIVLSEMFSTGFSMDAARLAETMDGRAVSWLREKSAARGAVLAGSLIISDGGDYFNRMVCALPRGELAVYDKKHLFRYAGEEKVYSSGNELLTIDVNGWRVRPFICYDLRFPIWTRNLNQAYDVALYVANWPTPRALHWQVLLKSRAIENQSYVVGVNRIGRDGNGNDYSGGSAVISPQGETLVDLENKEGSSTITLRRSELDAYRKRFPVGLDADDDMVSMPLSNL